MKKTKFLLSRSSEPSKRNTNDSDKQINRTLHAAVKHHKENQNKENV